MNRQGNGQEVLHPHTDMETKNNVITPPPTLMKSATNSISAFKSQNNNLEENKENIPPFEERTKLSQDIVKVNDIIYEVEKL